MQWKQFSKCYNLFIIVFVWPCSELIVASVNSWLITHYWSGWDLSACQGLSERNSPKEIWGQLKTISLGSSVGWTDKWGNLWISPLNVNILQLKILGSGDTIKPLRLTDRYHRGTCKHWSQLWSAPWERWRGRRKVCWRWSGRGCSCRGCRPWWPGQTLPCAAGLWPRTVPPHRPRRCPPVYLIINGWRKESYSNDDEWRWWEINGPWELSTMTYSRKRRDKLGEP